MSLSRIPLKNPAWTVDDAYLYSLVRKYGYVVRTIHNAYTTGRDEEHDGRQYQ